MTVKKDSLDKKVDKIANKFNKAVEYAFVNGLCFDCGKKIPNWNLKDKDWQKPKGWTIYDSVNNDPVLFICPECSKLESQDGSYQ